MDKSYFDTHYVTTEKYEELQSENVLVNQRLEQMTKRLDAIFKIQNYVLTELPTI